MKYRVKRFEEIIDRNGKRECYYYFYTGKKTFFKSMQGYNDLALTVCETVDLQYHEGIKVRYRKGDETNPWVDSYAIETASMIDDLYRKHNITNRNQQHGFVSDNKVYEVGYAITAFIVFIGAWMYCIAEYGFLLGVGLGWLPSLIVATIIGFFWPLILLAIVIITIAIIKG